MKGTESGKDKVKKICDILRRETLEPAISEAEAVIQSAKEKREEIVQAARKEAEKMLLEAKEEIERQKNIFQSSLGQACTQALESLKQGIEEKLFNQELVKIIAKHTQDPNVLVQLIEAVVHAVNREGIDASLSVTIPASVPARSVNALLAKEILEKLKEKSVLVGPLAGGLEVKLHKDNITLDLSDTALKELVARYIRKDFRELIFGAL
ncbi:MAG: V-type ATP synthase subunit E [Chlamydiota bacterium]